MSLAQRLLTALLAGAWLLLGNAAADYPIEIIELKGRLPEEVIPAIRPLAGSDGVVTGMNNQLILKVAPERLEDIKQVLGALDRPPRRLMIHVSQDSTERLRNRDISASGRIPVGDKSAVVIGGDPRPGLRVRAGDIDAAQARRVTQKVQAVEGRPALIRTGVSVPIRQGDQHVGPGGIYGRTYTDFVNADTGFYVVPRLQGNRVTLEIHTRMDQPDRRAGVFHTQQADTVVSGEVGKWIDLGGVTRTQSMDASGFTARSSGSAATGGDISVLVEFVK